VAWSGYGIELINRLWVWIPAVRCPVRTWIGLCHYVWVNHLSM